MCFTSYSPLMSSGRFDTVSRDQHHSVSLSQVDWNLDSPHLESKTLDGRFRHLFWKLLVDIDVSPCFGRTFSWSFFEAVTANMFQQVKKQVSSTSPVESHRHWRRNNFHELSFKRRKSNHHMVMGPSKNKLCNHWILRLPYLQTNPYESGERDCGDCGDTRQRG